MDPTFHAVVRSAACVIGTAGEPGFHRGQAGKSEVLVSRLPDGEVVAFAAECPHQATPLDASTFWEGTLRCGRHLYLYDLHTGENILPARESSPEAMRRLKPGYLPIHRTEERDGWIWVAEEPEPAPPCYDPAAEQLTSTGTATESAAAPPTPAETPAGSEPELVHVRVGDEFELVLLTTPRPAHLWRCVTTADEVSILSEGFAPDSPPRHIARLVAQAPGEAAVRFTYGTPWGGEPADARLFVVHIDP